MYTFMNISLAALLSLSRSAVFLLIQGKGRKAQARITSLKTLGGKCISLLSGSHFLRSLELEANIFPLRAKWN